MKPPICELCGLFPGRILVVGWVQGPQDQGQEHVLGPQDHEHGSELLGLDHGPGHHVLGYGPGHRDLGRHAERELLALYSH